MSKYRITLPMWLNTEVDSMTDRQIAEFVRMQAAVCRMQKEHDEAELERRQRYWELYARLPLVQRIKVRLGWMQI